MLLTGCATISPPVAESTAAAAYDSRADLDLQAKIQVRLTEALVDRIAKREVDPYTAASDILARALKPKAESR